MAAEGYSEVEMKMKMKDGSSRSVHQVKTYGGKNNRGKWVLWNVLMSVLCRVFYTERADPDQNQHQNRKTISIVSATILAANCCAIASLLCSVEKRDDGARQVVLIPSSLSLISTLFIIMLPLAAPKFNLRGAQKLLLLASFSSGFSYSAFVAIEFEPISKGTAIAMLLAGFYVLPLTAMFLVRHMINQSKRVPTDLRIE